jgi:uncharacterized membrane protein
VNRWSLIRVLFVICIAAYPFIIFFGIKLLPPSFFGLVLLVLLGMRYSALLPEERPILLPILLLFLAYALSATLLKSTTMLLYYPALVNFSLCTIFVNSLRLGDPLLLRFIRARGWPISVHGPRYLCRLTAIWAGFFLINGSISIWTSTLGIEIWTVYNGLISYFLIAMLVGGEYIFRLFYKRSMGVDNS